MQKQPSLRRGLLGLALGVLMTLFIAPQTGWMVRRQVLALVALRPLPGRCPLAEDRIRAVAAHNPNDEQLQYAAVQTNDRQRYIAGLRVLETRFPNDISLRANILRYCTYGQIHLYRSEESAFVQQNIPFQRRANTFSNTPQELSAFDIDAAAGERLDPDNAYFPFMRAIGLYAAHRDSDAQAALLRAGRMHIWREYYEDDVAAHWRLEALADGNPGAVWRASYAASVLFPHYAVLRTVARVALYEAMQCEASGHIKSGTALRTALLHISSLMRAQSVSGIGSLFALSLTGMALQRPGGAPYKSNTRVDTQVYPDLLVSDFCSYARLHGAPETARFAKVEIDAGTQAQTVLKTGTSGHDWLSNLSPFADSLFRLYLFWMAGMIVLANALWLGVWSGITSLLSQTRLVQSVQPLPRWSSVGIMLGVFISLIGIGLIYERPLTNFWLTRPDWVAYGCYGLIFAAVCKMLIFIKKHRKAIRRRPVILMLAVACLTVAIMQTIPWIVKSQGDFIDFFASLSQNARMGNGFNIPAICIAALPILLAVVCLVTARIRRIPLYVGLVQGFAAWALPVACVLIILYGGITLETLRRENFEDLRLTQSMQGEGAYIAKMTGQTWPSPVK